MSDLMNDKASKASREFAPPPALAVATAITFSAFAACAAFAAVNIDTPTLSTGLGAAAVALANATCIVGVAWRRAARTAATLNAISAQTRPLALTDPSPRWLREFAQIVVVAAQLTPAQLEDLQRLHRASWTTRHKRLMRHAAMLAGATHRDDITSQDMAQLKRDCPAAAMAAAAVLVRERLHPDDFAAMVHPWTTAHLPIPPGIKGTVPVWWTMQVQVWDPNEAEPGTMQVHVWGPEEPEPGWEPLGDPEEWQATTGESAQQLADGIVRVLEDKRATDIGRWRLAIWEGRDADTGTAPAAVAYPTSQLEGTGQ